MKRFADLINKLDQTTKTSVKTTSLKEYFEVAPDDDKMWTIALLSHRRPRRSVPTALLREWAAELADIPKWLFEESYHVVGDLAETIALVLPPAEKSQNKSLTHWIRMLKGLSEEEDEIKKKAVTGAWMSFDQTERFIFNKLITGGFRIGVSQKLMVKALSAHTGIEENTISHRLMGKWDPEEDDFEKLLFSENPLDDISKPYPFYLAYALEDEPSSLGKPSEWMAERKWDGIRGQIIIRNQQIFVWSRGEELVTDKFPEYQSLIQVLPSGTVLDGEIIAYRDGKPLSFNVLQTRIGRKRITQKVLTDAPVSFIVYDIMEHSYEDIREKPISERRALLEEMIGPLSAQLPIVLSERIKFKNWDVLVKEREQSREHNSEGLMLKKLDSAYQSGRRRGEWWKWKIDPLTVDAVMIYAMRGHGRRANLYTDYTFAVWSGEDLIPFTKAYSGLTDAEIREVDRYVKNNTLERFGPVRSVVPKLVFEIAFEGINRSTRHKSGIALRFPRIKRWRKDKPADEANTLQDLVKLLPEDSP